MKALKVLQVLKVVLLILVVIWVGYGVFQIYSSLVNAPLEVKVTNVTSTSATISWVTSSPRAGAVFTSKNSVLPWFLAGIGTQKSFDDRDYLASQKKCIEDIEKSSSTKVDSNFTTTADTSSCLTVEVKQSGNYFVHYVTVKDLDENSKYNFRISDGFWSWNTGGSSFNTFSELENVASPIPLFGRVSSEGNYSNDAIVYLTFHSSKDDKDSGVYSSLTNSDGGWYVDGANIRDVSGNPLTLEETQDTFIAKAQFKDYKLGGENKWIFGTFDGAFPDITVEKSLITSQLGEVVLGDDDVQKCGNDGAGNCLKAAAAKNGGVLTPQTMAATGICGNVSSCSPTQFAGNISVLTNTPISASNVVTSGNNTTVIKLKKNKDGSNSNSWDYCAGSGGCKTKGKKILTNPYTTLNTGGTGSGSGPITSGYSGGSCTGVGCTGVSAGAVVGTTLSVTYDKARKTATFDIGKQSNGFGTVVHTDINKYIPAATLAAIDASCNTATCQIDISAIPIDVVALYDGDPNLQDCVKDKSCDTKGLAQALKNYNTVADAASTDIQTAISAYKKTQTGNHSNLKVLNDNGTFSYIADLLLPITTGTSDSYTGSISFQSGDSQSTDPNVINVPGEASLKSINNCTDANGCSPETAKKLIAALETKELVGRNRLFMVQGPNGTVTVQYYPGEIYWLAQAADLKKKSADAKKLLTTLTPGSFLPNLWGSKVYAAEKNPDDYLLFLPEYGLYSMQLGDFEFKTETVGKKTAYIFYIETNGRPGFQAPKNPNAPKANEDRVIKSDSYKISYSKVATAREYSLKQGINLVSFDFIPSNGKGKGLVYTAKDLIKEAQGKGINIEYISYFDGGRWIAGLKCNGTCTGNDFQILPGKGYLVKVDDDADLSIGAYQLKSSIPVSLSAGWNLVGIQGYSQAFTAKSLIDSINAIGTIQANNVTWYPTSKGRYEGLQVANSIQYGFDFPISSTIGYFVRINKFSPANAACKSIIWHFGGTLNGKCGDSKKLF